MHSHSVAPFHPDPTRARSTRQKWYRETARCIRDMKQVLATVNAAMAVEGYSNEDLFAIRLSLDELIVNAMKHGHRGDRRKTVHIRYRVDAERVLVQVKDQGPGFDPDQVPDPLAPANRLRGSGRGLFLVRSYMTWVRFNKQGNCVTVCKCRS